MLHFLSQNNCPTGRVYSQARRSATGGKSRVFGRSILLSKKQRLTPEQNEIRLRGLRILARMIARAHLDAVAEAAVERQGEESDGR